MDNARNSYAIVDVLNRTTSYVCVVCLQKLDSPPIKLGCGCDILAHANCIGSKCPNCKKVPYCLSRSRKNDKLLALVIVLVIGLICITILLLVLKFQYKII